MNTHPISIPSFPLRGSAVHVAPGGTTRLLRGDAIRAHLQNRPHGLVLGAFSLATADDVHPDLWEMHPGGDEVLILLAGALALTYADGAHHGSTELRANQGLVMPRGVWHRLALRAPGLLLTLSPPAGTRFSREPGATMPRS